MQRIGIYGGTFDPIHHAHLILAREALEELNLDRVIFVPAAISPHKLHCAHTPAAIRLEMLQAAIAGESRFGFDELELHRPGPSFTIDTIEEFRRRDADAEMFYFIGSDNLPRLESWHRYADLQTQITFVVLERGASPPTHSYPFVTRRIEISATDIRNRVAIGQSIRYFVPPAVEEIIQRHQLYQEPDRSPPKI